jgi:hypothetical protein
MDRREFIKKAVIILIAILVIGGAGFFIGKNIASDNSSDQPGSNQGTVYTNASDMRKDLNIKLAEHVALTTEAMRVSYDEHESSTAAVDELDKNSHDLANIIGNFYGDEPKSTFLKLWQDHVTFLINYTISAKNGDKEGKDQALSDLEDYSQESAEFFAGLNGNLSVDSLKSLFTEHRDLMIASIDDYIDEKYPESLDKESKAYDQAGKIADTISDGIIKQFPSKFSE